MEIRPISVTEWLPVVEPLIRAHWNEVALNKGVMVLKPNVALYADLEAADRLVAFGAFDGDELVGYAVTILQPSHLHYADLFIASNDVLFVLPEHRGASRAGYRLIAETERACADRGARLMLWHAKPDTALQKLMPRLGYGVQDVIYSKELAWA